MTCERLIPGLTATAQRKEALLEEEIHVASWRLGRETTSSASEHTFVGVSALLFAASATVTIVWCASMSAMGGMPMPGGWVMSMAWMRMPGQTWLGAAASFLGMWIVMVVAMMLPS